MHSEANPLFIMLEPTLGRKPEAWNMAARKVGSKTPSRSAWASFMGGMAPRIACLRWRSPLGMGTSLAPSRNNSPTSSNKNKSSMSLEGDADCWLTRQRCKGKVLQLPFTVLDRAFVRVEVCKVIRGREKKVFGTVATMYIRLAVDALLL